MPGYRRLGGIFPEALLGEAIRGYNRNLAWPLDRSPFIIEHAASKSLATTWVTCFARSEKPPRGISALPVGSDKFPLIPLVNGDVEIYDWSGVMREATEDWVQFVARSAALATDYIDHVRANLGEIVPEVRESIWCSLCFQTEEEYRRSADVRWHFARGNLENG